MSPLLLVSPSPARADIFQWEYINPADPSQGKQQSSTLAPDGAGVDAVPGADLRLRNLRMAYLSANLTNADLSQANLTNASFDFAFLTDAEFTGAEVRGASFDKDYCYTNCFGTGITPAQLYSTASYQAHDLSGIKLGQNDLSGGNFAGQNLTNASFVSISCNNDLRCGTYSATLTGADFRQANLTNADVGPADMMGANLRGANLTNANFLGHFCVDVICRPAHAALTDADLTAADSRGAYLLSFRFPADAIAANLIWPDGHIIGLDLDVGGLLVMRDFDGNPTQNLGRIPITVDQHLAMGPGGTLRMVFEADAWDSTISFAPGIPVTLGGTLELAFAADVNLASQIGRTFDLFDWTGVTPTGAFAISTPHHWNLSNLYTTGEVTLTGVPEAATLGLSLLALALFVCHVRSGRFARVSIDACMENVPPWVV